MACWCVRRDELQIVDDQGQQDRKMAQSTTQGSLNHLPRPSSPILTPAHPAGPHRESNDRTQRIPPNGTAPSRSHHAPKAPKADWRGHHSASNSPQRVPGVHMLLLWCVARQGFISETTHRQSRPSSMMRHLSVVNPVKGLCYSLFLGHLLCATRFPNASPLMLHLALLRLEEIRAFFFHVPGARHWWDHRMRTENKSTIGHLEACP